MKAEDSITLWHFEEGGERVTRLFFSGVHLYFQKRITKSGIKEKGFHREESAVVRIPGENDIPVACGDYFMKGQHTDDEPDYSRAFKVTEICDNRKGLSPHWKLSCGG